MEVHIDWGILEGVDATLQGVSNGGLSQAESERALVILADAQVAMNLVWLKNHPTPHPYQAGIRYKREPARQEKWKIIPRILADGHGDCEDLACYLAAYYRFHGRAADVVFTKKKLPSGAWLYHVMVKTPDGIEDPSRVLGMGA